MKKINYANRGIFLEKIINLSLQYWLQENKIIAFKQPTPIGIFKKNFFFKNKTNVDYHGMYKSRYFCFEAKMTRLLYFPLNNFSKHQLNYLKLIFKNQGISFVIIFFVKKKSYFAVNFEKIYQTINQNKKKLNYD
jgi:recombination protein U